LLKIGQKKTTAVDVLAKHFQTPSLGALRQDRGSTRTMNGPGEEVAVPFFSQVAPPVAPIVAHAVSHPIVVQRPVEVGRQVGPFAEKAERTADDLGGGTPSGDDLD